MLISVVRRAATWVSCVVPALALAAPPGRAPVADAWAYQVVAGDTLDAIARTHLAPGIGWQRLQQFNGVRDPRRLSPGQTLKLPFAWLRTEASTARVVFVTGEARRRSLPAGPAGESALVALGDTLGPGDLLTTAADASVTLELADGSRVLIAGGSRVRMESLQVVGDGGQTGVARTRLGVEAGEAESRVNPERKPGTRYDVRTPALTLGVRGTEFRVRVASTDSGPTAVSEVTEGRVAATTPHGPAQSVAAGYGVVAAPNGLSRPRPLPGAPRLDGVPTRQERLPLAFSWPADAGAVAYRAQVLAQASDDERLLDGVFDRPAAEWADLPDGHYVLQVRSRDADGLEGLGSRLTFTLKARPEPPFQREPAQDGRVYGERVTFAWTTSPAAERYRLQVANTAGFDAPQVDRDNLREPRAEVALPPGRYHWRIASIAPGDDAGPFSDAAGFELRETPPPPALDAPTAEGKSMVFRWRARAPGDRYDVQVARDSAFTQLVVDRQVDAPELSLEPPGPGLYHLRVRTRTADGFAGPWGSAQQFEVPHSRWWWLAPGALILLLAL